LKETEADTKNLFGSYGSQRMKDWLEIEKLYLKDNVYLAEACDLLVQNIKYHIPAVKKQIAKLQSGQTVNYYNYQYGILMFITNKLIIYMI